jgi:hypothetical protein
VCAHANTQKPTCVGEGHDTARQLVLRFNVALDLAVCAFEVALVIVPVCRHGKGVADVQSGNLNVLKIMLSCSRYDRWKNHIFHDVPWCQTQNKVS